MTSIFDNVSAVIIGGVVVLILFVVQWRAGVMSSELFSMYSGKQSSLNLATLLEDDLELLGRNMDIDDSLFTVPVQSGGNTTSFTFFHQDTDSTGLERDMEVRYRLASTEIISKDTSTIQLYELIREQRNVNSFLAAWHQTWSSDRRLSHFYIEPQDERYLPTHREDETTYLRISFTMIPPYQTENQYVRQLNWSTTINVRPF